MVEINWNALRALNGRQEDGFEELCAQLARAETPADAEFFRKGSPDSGVECYCVLANGDEWGCQAKYFTSALGDSQWRQLDQSVKRALDDHPRLTRYLICVPRDRSDGRRQSTKTEMARWDERVAKWRAWAAEREMSVEFTWWGSSELTHRLSQEEHIGRRNFWFRDHTRFSHEWFHQRLDEAIASAGPRYTPKVHIDLSVAQKLRLFGREDEALNSVQATVKDIQDSFRLAKPREDEEDTTDQEGGLQALQEAGKRVRAAFQRLDASPNNDWQIAPLIKEIDSAIECADAAVSALTISESTAESDSARASQNRERQPRSLDERRAYLYNLLHVLRTTRTTLEMAEPFVNNNLVILTGEAGIGKTHLLCDIARQRVDAGLPTILLMGQRFLTKDAPWVQGLQHLDCTDLGAKKLVGALEAAAQTANARALLMIDALNEGEGAAIWPTHLAAFLKQANRSPWIACVLSVRSTYRDVVIPDHVQGKAVPITHVGFAERSYDATRTFFEHYGLALPSTPLMQPEFDNPLFLKLFCQSLSGSGHSELPRGQHGISQVFNSLLEDVNQRLSNRLDYNPDERPVHAALSALAAEFAERGYHWIPRPDAEQIVNAFVSGAGFSRSLYRALVSEGLLFENPDFRSPQQTQKVVSISFERFADHLIAEHFVESYLNKDEPAAAFQPTGQLAFLLEEQDFIWRGVIEALCIQIPEQFGVELPQLAPTLFESSWGRSAFLASLTWRSSQGSSDDTRRQFIELLRRSDGPRRDEVFNTLLRVSTIPGHPLNAGYLHDLLQRWSMPDRDALWSVYLHEVYTYGSGGPVDRLLDWPDDIPAEARDSIDDEVVDLAATTLTWMLTTSNRFVRDRATKGLVWLLTGRLAATTRLVDRFCDVDDLYVVERVYAVAYGVATRCHEPADLEQLAKVVYRSVFADGRPTPHVLLRDYARGIVERALHLGTGIEVDADLIRPPYRSEWPHVPSEAELNQLAPRPDPAEVGRFDPKRAADSIHFSVTFWDFASYIIGTNHGITRWTGHRLEEERWTSPQERMETFMKTLSPEQHRVLSEYQVANTKMRLLYLFDDSMEESTPSSEPATQTSDLHVSKLDLNSAITDATRSRDLFLSVLTQSQQDEYLSVEGDQFMENDNFDVSIIQRYILWRVFDLGWTVERFGGFDVQVDEQNEHRGREANKPERIGKKYQWIAYHEILAYIADHYQFDSRYSYDPSRHRYNGPWQLHRRDIDPTASTRTQSRVRIARAEQKDWWRGPDFADWRPEISDLEWLSLQDDLQDPSQFLHVRSADDETKWLNLRAFRTWKDRLSVELDDGSNGWREVWIRADAYLVDVDHVDAFHQWGKEVDFRGVWMPEPHHVTEVFLGEHGWAPAFKDIFGDSADRPVAVERAPSPCPALVHLTASEYLSEAGGYDCSIEESQRFLVPSKVMITGMGLWWTGEGTDFCDQQGRLAAFDPAPTESSASLLVREDLLRQFLEREGLALVWAVFGEKTSVGGTSGRNWAGSLHFTGAYRYNPDSVDADRIRGGLRYRLDLPETQGV